MYLDFYKLNLKPFQISTDPRFLWLGEKHEEALAVLKYAIRDNRGFLLLTGDVGTGKTTLLNALIDSLGNDVLVALVTDPGLAKLDFFNYVADSFELDKTFRSKGQFLIFMKRFLLDVNRQNKQALLIIDESQNLNQKMLEEVRLLSNIEKATTKLINIFFVGQIEFNDIIRRQRNRAIRQRITVNYNISELAEPETAAYIRYRLKVAGSEEPIFTADAIHAVYQFSKGYPRLINIICDQAMLTAYVKGRHQIGSAIVNECAAELKLADGMTAKYKKIMPGAVVREPPELTPAGIAAAPKPEPFNLRFNKPLVLVLGVIVVLLLVLEVALFRNRQDSATINKSVAAVQQPNTDAVREIVQPEPDQADSSLDKVSTDEASTSGSGQDEKARKPSSDAAKLEPSLPAGGAQPPAVAGPDTIAGGQPASQQPLAVAGATKDAAVTEKRIQLAAIKNGFGEYPEVKFGLNANTLDTEAYYLLGLISRYIGQHPETALILRGYTDKSGTRAYNLKLAEFRADMVKTYLVGRGVPADTITTLAIGPDPQGPGGTQVPYDGARRKVIIEIIAPE